MSWWRKWWGGDAPFTHCSAWTGIVGTPVAGPVRSELPFSWRKVRNKSTSSESGGHNVLHQPIPDVYRFKPKISSFWSQLSTWVQQEEHRNLASTYITTCLTWQQFKFVCIPFVCLSKGSRAREPALRRESCDPANWFFTSSGSAGGFGKALNWSSSLHSTGSFGFCQQTNTLAANPSENAAPREQSNRNSSFRRANSLNISHRYANTFMLVNNYRELTCSSLERRTAETGRDSGASKSQAWRLQIFRMSYYLVLTLNSFSCQSVLRT